MATSAFKSTTRRDTATQPSGPPPSRRRRSHSVSAVSRKTHLLVEDNSSKIEYSNSRDNPLFWAPSLSSSSSSPPNQEDKGRKTSEIACLAGKSNSNSSSRSDNGVGQERGRSVSRNGVVKKGIGRSLSRGRVYQDKVVSAGVQGIDKIKRINDAVDKSNSAGSRAVALRCLEKVGRRKVENQATDWSEDDSACSLRISNFEDEISVDSLSEAEEKTIKAVCEDLNTSRRNDIIHAVKATNVADIPPDLVNPGAVELISDIRREYAMKLEQSEERARKLRQDLATEEQRGHELDRILKEILPDPKISSVQRSRRRRKTSNERKRMSNRLTEEAMAFFDECVSISTFDSSDFSAPDDPLFCSSRPNISMSASSSSKGCPTMFCDDQGSSFNQSQQLQRYVDSGRTTTNNSSSSTAETGSAQQYQFSFADQQSQNVGPDEDINNYVKHFARSTIKDTHSYYAGSSYDADEYSNHANMESVLIDRVLHARRFKLGGLLLCGGAISCQPFASIL